jgi:hypothetical protein
MSNVDRVGTFRFDKVLSIGLSAGKPVSEDDPQPRSITFSALIHLSEFWDTEESVWVDWADADVEVTAFLPLHFFDKKTSEQAEFSIRKKVVEVFGWDGASFKTLCDGDYGEVTGQVRFEDDTYEKAKFPFKVAWLDTFDATPGRQLRQITGDDLKSLDKIMASTLKKTAKPAKAATVKKTAKMVKGKASGSFQVNATANATGRPTAPKTDAIVGKCTGQEAYDECFALSGSEGGDELEDKLNQVWTEEAAKVNVDETKITDEEWFEIKGRVSKRTSKV